MSWLSTHWRGIFATSIFIASILSPAAWYCAKRPPPPPEPCVTSVVLISGQRSHQTTTCSPGATLRLVTVNDGALALCECLGAPNYHRSDGGAP